MAEPSPVSYTSIGDYLQLELVAEARHEYHHGELFAMAGGTRNRAILGNAINTELNLVCRKTTCIPYNGDMRIRIESENCFLYPEASVVCGPLLSSPHDKDSMLNPVLVAEVLSPGSEAYDRGRKFHLYQSLPSLKEYLLISQQEPLVELYFREGLGLWRYEAIRGLETEIRLRSLNAAISMKDLYQNVVWEE